MNTCFILILFNVVAIQYTQAIKCYVCQNCTIPTQNHLKECESEDHDQCKVEIVEKRVNRMCHENMRQRLGCKDKTEQCYCDSNECNDNKELKDHFCSKKEQFGEDFKENFPMICIEPVAPGAGLPVGAIVGIAAGAIVVFAIIAAVAFVFIRKQNDTKADDKNEEDAGTNLLVIENGETTEKKDESKSENIAEKKGEEKTEDNNEQNVESTTGKKEVNET